MEIRIVAETAASFFTAAGLVKAITALSFKKLYRTARHVIHIRRDMDYTETNTCMEETRSGTSK